jgi:hypothetical protein
MNAHASERRLAPRFPIHGPVSVSLVNDSAAKFFAEIYDISLNGALLSLPPEAKLEAGNVVDLELSLQGIPHVVARATVAHVRDDRFGVEFSDMETRDFNVFTGLVLMLEQRNRINLIDTA